ncbi:uncharacterized protein ARMOST_21807 [Armillaria ostoyae]|uniref:Uncharacterized protein n=1 Tax=Armillaria ostoyae TaxID=47428 RepID=A0A284SB90_ARMOS|nr:uncharacterized protein ARMOST_21807 [Armillaria ostoyae]
MSDKHLPTDCFVYERLYRGVVESTSRTSDGTLMIVIKRDSGGTVTLPAAGVSNGAERASYGIQAARIL